MKYFLIAIVGVAIVAGIIRMSSHMNASVVPVTMQQTMSGDTTSGSMESGTMQTGAMETSPMNDTGSMVTTGAMMTKPTAQTTTLPSSKTDSTSKPPIAVVVGFNAATWVKPSSAVLRTKLTATQYTVTQEDGTETPYHNAYWDNHEAGIYVDIVSGEPLFSSTNKYDSDTGRPSFTKPISPSAVTLKSDTTLGFTRTEVRSKYANSHLGHVFDDGPQPLGTRYCMNSASLLFIPVKDLEVKGYGKYKEMLFPSH